MSTHQLDVFLFDNQTAGPQGDRIGFYPASATSLCGAPAAELNRLFGDAQGEFVAFANCPTAGPWDDALDCLHENPSAALAVCPFKPRIEGIDPWDMLPAPLACFIQPIETTAAVVFRRSAWPQSPFQDVSAPLWDAVLRVALEEREVVAVSGSNTPSTGPLPQLAPSAPGRDLDWLHTHVEQAEADRLLADRQIVSRADAAGLQAGLFQIHDWLDDSHTLSQSVQGKGRHSAGDYWHAIMHRREPDYGNSKYWFGRVGHHPVFDRLVPHADRLLQAAETADAKSWRDRLTGSNKWDAFAFVEFCQACCQTGDGELAKVARQIQWAEMLLLLEQTLHDAAS